MDSIILEVIKLIDKYGTNVIYGIVAILFLYTIIYFKTKTFFGTIYTWLGETLSKFTDRFIEKFMRNKTKDVNTGVRKINESDIMNHDIFNYIDFWTYSKVPTFQFSSDYRTAVFRKYLTLYLKNYKKNIEKFITDKSYETMDEPQILKNFLNLINTTVYDYEREMVEVGIPSIVIERMKVKNNDNILLTIDLVEGICSSQFYDSENNLLKIYSILNILLTILESTVNSSEVICNGINGALAGLTFNGHTEPKHK